MRVGGAMIPQITVRPEKRYDRYGKHNRGARRHDGPRGRTLALLDLCGVTKRPLEIRPKISIDGYSLLEARAEQLGVTVFGLAAYLIEAALRKDNAS